MNKNIVNFLLISGLIFNSYYASANTMAEPLIASTSDLENGTEGEQEPQVTVRPGHARALAELANEKYQDIDSKTLMVKVELLTDNQGLSYLAGTVQRADIEQYLKQLRLILGEDYQTYRQHQASRDDNAFHVTLVNPYEYQALIDKTTSLSQKVSIQLHGLGRVSQGKHSSYFVVASSADGQFLRQNLLLPTKDFHITLGFKEHDIHGVSKGEETLIR